MRILFVLEHFYPYIGGAEKLFWELAQQLTASGHQVGVITTRFRKDLPHQEKLQGIQVFRVDCKNRFLFSFLSLPAIWKQLRHYDLVHTTSYNAALPAWLGARLRGKPVIVTFHEVWGRLWWKLPFANFVQRLAFFSWEALLLRLPFTRFVGVSEFSKQELLRHGVKPQRVLRIYNGLDYEQYESVMPDKSTTGFSYTYFGRLGMSKGLDLLLPAAAIIAREYPDARFHLVVPTYPENMFQWLMNSLKALNLLDRVFLHHDLPRKDLQRLVKSSNCVVIPSYSEGFCFVAAETVALGTPVISSQRGALSEVVGGRYLPMSEMKVEALVEAMRSAHDEAWKEKTPKQFPLQEAVENYLTLYKDVLRC